MTFKQDIEALSGNKVNLCFQCNKCSAGCPLIEKMDLKPAQVMHSVRLGYEEKVLSSKTIWLCVSCETCSSRCPQQVMPSAVMEAARVLAIRRGVTPSVREVSIYFRGFVNNMRLNGKIHDASLAAATRLMTGQLIEDLPLAWKLLLKGRVTLPPIPRGSNGFRKIIKKTYERERLQQS